MIIMQIAQTETPPIDENFSLGSLGFQKKKRFALQPTKNSTSVGSSCRLHLFTIGSFFF